MCRGYAAAQEAYDRQLPPEDGILPHCPECGTGTDTLYKNKHGIVGCPECIKTVDAWEEKDE